MAAVFLTGCWHRLPGAVREIAWRGGPIPALTKGSSMRTHQEKGIAILSAGAQIHICVRWAV